MPPNTREQDVSVHSCLVKLFLHPTFELQIPEQAARSATPERMASDRDGVTYLDALASPATRGDRANTATFYRPYRCRSLGTHDLKVDPGMRIYPVEFRYSTLQNLVLRQIVVPVGMVCQ